MAGIFCATIAPHHKDVFTFTSRQMPHQFFRSSFYGTGAKLEHGWRSPTAFGGCDVKNLYLCTVPIQGVNVDAHHRKTYWRFAQDSDEISSFVPLSGSPSEVWYNIVTSPLTILSTTSDDEEKTKDRVSSLHLYRPTIMKISKIAVVAAVLSFGTAHCASIRRKPNEDDKVRVVIKREGERDR
eukprot:scaffold34603_cov212-Amphora_coffeaeformis.AAC.24